MTPSQDHDQTPPTTGGVLVTGSHRSGSTWVGRLLGAADELHYLHEPFNIVARIRWTASRPPHQFEYLRVGTDTEWSRQLAGVMELRLPVRAQWLEAARERRLRRLMATAREARAARGDGRKPLVKDPIALFSTPWLAHHLGLRPVILVRNARSFVGSLKQRGWAFDFSHWTGQPRLMEDLLADYRHDIEAQAAQPGSIVEQGIVQWNAMYSVVDRFRREHPEWVVVRYEDLAADPAGRVPELYRALGLGFGPRQQAELARLTEGGGGEGRSAMDLRRDSGAALHTWKDRLTDDEIALVTERTAPVSALWYP